jgi:hypothetical protein
MLKCLFRLFSWWWKQLEGAPLLTLPGLERRAIRV